MRLGTMLRNALGCTALLTLLPGLVGSHAFADSADQLLYHAGRQRDVACSQPARSSSP